MKKVSFKDLSYTDILLNVGLYTEITINVTDYEELKKFIYNTEIMYDSYCLECDNNSFFKVKEEDTRSVLTEVPLARNILPSYIEEDEEDEEDDIDEEFEYLKINNAYFSLTFTCVRDPNHRSYFNFIINNNQNTMIKIGQYPSIADISINKDIKEYRKILGDYYKEFSKSIGLYANGIGIGSFVYLRRIFESLISEQYQIALVQEKWEKDEIDRYNTLKVVEKIKYLSKYLPSHIVDNPQLYGIISKGIHELSEEECNTYFGTLKTAILIILHQVKSRKDELKLIEENKKEINKVNTQLKSPSSN